MQGFSFRLVCRYYPQGFTDDVSCLGSKISSPGSQAVSKYSTAGPFLTSVEGLETVCLLWTFLLILPYLREIYGSFKEGKSGVCRGRFWSKLKFLGYIECFPGKLLLDQMKWHRQPVLAAVQCLCVKWGATWGFVKWSAMDLRWFWRDWIFLKGRKLPPVLHFSCFHRWNIKSSFPWFSQRQWETLANEKSINKRL